MPSNNEKKLFGKTKLVHDFTDTFETAQGESTLLHLIKKYHVLKPSFAPGCPHATSFQEGQRSVVLYILHMAKKDHSELIKAIQQYSQYDDDLPTSTDNPIGPRG